MTVGSQVRCAIYTRKSTEEGLEQEFNSLDAQREACEAYVASQKSEGWVTLPARYDDGGYSGGTLDRPALQNLLKHIEKGGIDVIVVYKIDRLSRSLMDFAKMVEVFDRKSVTFVSVTQSFNTTTSMGRLTLNVLLSFAQFEREVTGERIRDKFAASKKRGMWMGGYPPLGYDIASRKLVVNPAEAETVKLIFRSYLELGCVQSLQDDLSAKRIVSKRWTASTGVEHGGQPFGRGALYCLLKNRVYVGEIVHKAECYPGEHQAIVPRDLFDAVQSRMTSYRRREPGKPNSEQGAILMGRLFDEAGRPMTPTYSAKPNGRRYRYYAGRSRAKCEPLRGSISRVPAPVLEDIVMKALERLQLPCGRDEASGGVPTLRRVTVKSNSLAIELDRPEVFQRWRIVSIGFGNSTDRGLIDDYRSQLASGEDLSDDGERLILTLPIRARFRGGRAAMISPKGTTRPPLPDAALIKALARAHSWKHMLMDGEVRSVEALAARVGQERRHVGRTLNLSFLSPDLTRSLLNGEQPPGLRLTHLLDADIPLSWREQRAMVARLSATATP